MVYSVAFECNVNSSKNRVKCTWSKFPTEAWFKFPIEPFTVPLVAIAVV